ncbi:hypothetical protein CUMW_266770 [Citrus unshiu]|uniref:Uncharacterized protein n=1 Tax=Citrus unshiu TaxID=55188 RepID=A0A2H5QVZ6_CITUN|nr:hypothetical protein CUMW_266770 [Citrus unshiu]
MSNLGKGMEGSKTRRPGGQNENVEPLYSETWLNDDNCPPNQNKHDLVSRKRQKLHQWVADIIRDS